MQKEVNINCIYSILINRYTGYWEKHPSWKSKAYWKDYVIEIFTRLLQKRKIENGWGKQNFQKRYDAKSRYSWLIRLERQELIKENQSFKKQDTNFRKVTCSNSWRLWKRKGTSQILAWINHQGTERRNPK